MGVPLEQIDTSVIEELMELKRDRVVLAARLDRMTTESDKVSPPVFQRVRADYQSRLGTLDQRASPLKDQARQEHIKLHRLLGDVEAQRAAALQDQEELELRHRLGEFEEKEFTAKSSEVAQRITGLDREVAAVTAVRERFVAAFDSEDELMKSPPPPPPAAAAPRAAAPAAAAPAVPTLPATPAPPPAAPVTPEAAAPAPPPAAAATGVTGTRSGRKSGAVAPPDTAPIAEPEAPVAPEAPVVPSGATVIPLSGSQTMVRPGPHEVPNWSAKTTTTPTLGGTVVLADLPLSPTDTGGGTMIVSFARLVPLDDDGERGEFRVQPFTTIGRTRQNNVQLDAPSVSRKHAQITLTDTGYVVRDLGSENGTFVNGDRITEQRLAEGDHLQFGALRFSFHSA